MTETDLREQIEMLTQKNTELRSELLVSYLLLMLSFIVNLFGVIYLAAQYLN